MGAAPARVLLANLPRLLSQIVREILGEHHDIAVVGEVSLDDLHAAIATLALEALILGVSRHDARSVGPLRAAHPGLAVLEIALHDERAVLWPPRAVPRAVELSPSGIVAAIRKGVIA